MSSMDFATILFKDHLRFDPKDPNWLGRDRFVLSAGHESMLLYAFLYAIGWLELADLQKFRRLHSRTPGHPEYGITPGVECTTGPLGQGCGMSVGMAMAQKHLAATLGSELYDYHIWTLMGDGCYQEDITYAAASLAGHLKLNNLIWYYDRNARQISGEIERTISDDVGLVYRGLGWKVIEIDGHDHTQIEKAITQAKTNTKSPTLIVGLTTMAKGSHSMEGNHDSHGVPFSKDEQARTKALLDVPAGESFYWPDSTSTFFQQNFVKKSAQVKNWYETKTRLSEKDPTFKTKFKAHYDEAIDLTHLSKQNWDKDLATRQAFGLVLKSWAQEVPRIFGGSADLEPSNMTQDFADLVKDFQANYPLGRNVAYGVREFPMAAISNGIALHGGLLPFDATFLSFSDYSRPALRLGALQKLGVIHEFTHDSIYLGEDGPTHQPIEHLMSLRAMPGLYVMRPADSKETEVLMQYTLNLKAPSAICLSRQKVVALERIDSSFSGQEQAKRGAWIVKRALHLKAVIYATGSEVQLALLVAKELEQTDPSLANSIQVVSVPCWELFFEQDKAYQEEILVDHCQARISIELGTTLGWERFVGRHGLCLGIDRFGESAQIAELEEYFGFTPAKISQKIRTYLQ